MNLHNDTLSAALRNRCRAYITLSHGASGLVTSQRVGLSTPPIPPVFGRSVGILLKPDTARLRHGLNQQIRAEAGVPLWLKAQRPPHVLETFREMSLIHSTVTQMGPVHWSPVHASAYLRNFQGGIN